MTPLQEDFRLPVGRLLGLAAALLITISIAGLLIWQWQKHRSENGWHEKAPLQSPRQQLEFETGQLARSEKQRQQQDLQKYAWKDSQHQSAKIPLTRAMDLFLKRKPQ